jgi:hypothetical protein
MDECGSSSVTATGPATEDPDPWRNSLAKLRGTGLTAGGRMD